MKSNFSVPACSSGQLRTKPRRALRWRVACCALLCLCALLASGCQLAKEGGPQPKEDALIGTLVTLESLDLFDMEAYLNDPIGAPIRNNGPSATADPFALPSTSRYEGRLYATCTAADAPEKADASYVPPEYVFEGVDGISLFCPKVKRPDSEEYTVCISGEGINNAHLTSGSKSSVTGTVYVQQGKSTTIHLNPVYQSGDGSVYAISGTGIMVGEYGGSASSSISQSSTVTENGKKTETGMTVTVQIELRSPTERVRVIQMNAENSVVTEDAFTQPSLPESLTPDPNAAYLVIESHTDAQGEAAVQREIVNRGTEYFITYVPYGDALLTGKPVALQWGE